MFFCPVKCILINLDFSALPLDVSEKEKWKKKQRQKCSPGTPLPSRRPLTSDDTLFSSPGHSSLVFTTHIIDGGSCLPKSLPPDKELALIKGLDCRMASCLLSSRALKMLGPMNTISLDTQ